MEKVSENWVRCSINEVADKIHYGYTATANNTNDGAKYLRITDIQDGEVNWSTVPNCTISRDEFLKFKLNFNDIVFARTGGTVGKSFLIRKDVPQNAIFASYLIRIVLNNNVDPKFIHLFFQSSSYWFQIELGKTGLKTNVNAQILSKIEFNLPPLPEQRAILAKIEQLFSDLDNGIANLKKAQEQLKTYRQAVLKWAFEGKLTNENVKDGELPEGWKKDFVKNISLNIQYGYTESSSREAIGPKFLRITDIQNYRVFWDEVPYCKINDEEKKKYLLKDGDLVFARTGATVGKSFLIEGEIPEAIFASYLIRLRFPRTINNKYVWYFFQSPFYWSQIVDKQIGIGQPNVNGTKLGQLEIILCSGLEEQKKIVQEIETRLSVCDNIEANINESFAKAEALRQSILKKAFEGKLLNEKELEAVRNSSDWEPAEKLLERIEREKKSNQILEINIKETKISKIKKNMNEVLKTILQILQESKEPVKTKILWQSSIYRDDIDAFYDEIKKLIERGEIKETKRIGKESFLKLTKPK